MNHDISIKPRHVFVWPIKDLNIVVQHLNQYALDIVFQVGANLEPSVKKRLTQLLHDYVEVFYWSYEDMPRLDTDIVVHHIPIKEVLPLIKQKVCRMHPDMSEKIKTEVMKQFNAGFLAVTSYP